MSARGKSRLVCTERGQTYQQERIAGLVSKGEVRRVSKGESRLVIKRGAELSVRVEGRLASKRKRDFSISREGRIVNKRAGGGGVILVSKRIAGLVSKRG